MDTPMTTGAFDYEGPPDLREPIEQALRKVIDPEVALNIVDIGLVYSVRVEPGAAWVEMTMTTQACPVTDMLLDEVAAELGDALGDSFEIEVRLVWEPPWTPDRLSLQARRFMGW
jgi:metal-sulfur cluster biosynthetic enzyme